MKTPVALAYHGVGGMSGFEPLATPLYGAVLSSLVGWHDRPTRLKLHSTGLSALLANRIIGIE
jgi:hypothetical protein